MVFLTLSSSARAAGWLCLKCSRATSTSSSSSSPLRLWRQLHNEAHKSARIATPPFPLLYPFPEPQLSYRGDPKSVSYGTKCASTRSRGPTPGGAIRRAGVIIGTGPGLCELRRITLLGTSVNRTKKKDRGGSKLRLGRTPDTTRVLYLVLYLAFNLRGKHR